MRFNPRARLDTGQVSDSGRGGLGGGGMRIPIPGGTKAGGGIGGLLLLLVLFIVAQCAGIDLTGGALPTGSGLDTGQMVPSDSGRYDNCRTGEDANTDEDCARVAVENSLRDFWEDQQLPGFQPATMQTFTGAVSTACGRATSEVGPFYCPADARIYLDTTFFRDVLQRQLGGPSGAFVEPYVIGHEYGHHIQNVLGAMGRVRTQRGPRSDAVRLELQADCFAGMWTRAATSTDTPEGVPLIEELTQQDVREALGAAQAVGDDRIQQKTQGQVTEETWTHGSAESRMRWFTTGYEQRSLEACDTWATDDL